MLSTLYKKLQIAKKYKQMLYPPTTSSTLKKL